MAQDDETTFAKLLLAGMREAAAHARGDLEVVRRTKITRRLLRTDHLCVRRPGAFPQDRIRALRDGLGVSQAVFADLLNVSLSTVRAWEQGQRRPHGPSLRLLEVAEEEPMALLGLASLEASA